MVLKAIALVTRRAAGGPGGDATTCAYPEEAVVPPLCTTARVSKRTPDLRNSGVTVPGRGRDTHLTVIFVRAEPSR